MRQFKLELAFFVSLLASSLLAQGGWVDLFNGKNLDGWEEHGGHAKYYVQDGVIVGESVTNTGNSFLCPVKTYGDFEMMFDYLVDGALNSGVQFRSDVFPGVCTWHIDGKTIKLPPDRLDGYQCEIDMDAKLPAVPKSPSNHFANFFKACMGEEKCRSNFALAGPLCQTMSIGVIAQCVNARLAFDPTTQPITNHKAANELPAGVLPRKDWKQFCNL